MCRSRTESWIVKYACNHVLPSSASDRPYDAFLPVAGSCPGPIFDELDAVDIRRVRSLEGAGVACPELVGENSVKPGGDFIPGEGRSPG